MHNFTLIFLFILYFTPTFLGASPPIKSCYNQISSHKKSECHNSKNIRVGVFLPANPPYSFNINTKKTVGISSDYTFIIARNLGVSIEMIHYPNRALALDALNDDKVDMLIDDSEIQLYDTKSYLSSVPLIADEPALVTRETRRPELTTTKRNPNIALSSGYLSDEWVRRYYPDANIIRYNSSLEALSSVAFKKNDFFIGNLIIANFLIDRNYGNVLSILERFPMQNLGPRFIFKYDDFELKKTINMALDNITLEQRKEIYLKWILGADLSQYKKPINLTLKEQQWLDKNKELQVIVDPLNAPFTMLNPSGKFYGISAEILKLLHIRTGLNFNVIESNHVNSMTYIVPGKDRIIMSRDFSKVNTLLTEPYMGTPFVLVVKKNWVVQKNLSNIKKLAITPDNILKKWIELHYPKITLVKFENANDAMRMVIDGTVDASINNLVSANYIIEHYFHGQLRIDRTLGDSLSKISFSVPSNQPELYSILNKAIAEIPKSDISLFINKWQPTPDIKLQTWVVYRTQFYWLIGVFSTLVISSLIWNFYLRREIVLRKEVQSKLQEQIYFRDTLFIATPVPLYVVDINGEIILRSQAWNEFFKIKPSVLSRIPLTSPKHPLATIYLELCMILRSPDIPTPEPVRYSINDGEKDHSIIHYSVLFRNSRGEPAGLICSWQDITYYEYLMAETSSACERAEQANRAKSDFLATMSHDIRTPVNSILGLLELLVTRKEDYEMNMDSIHIAYETAQSLTALVGDILDMDKIESGKLELSPEWVTIYDLSNPIVQSFKGLARNKNLKLNYYIEEIDFNEVYIDVMRWRQVLSNLISNSIKFTTYGSVDVFVTNRLMNNQKIMLELVVNDTGVGIDSEEQVDIFAPYKQSYAGKKQTGSGLGLAICAQLVTLMGGEIKLDSKLECGTSIRIRMPLEGRLQARKIKNDTNILSTSEHPLYILVVDDHATNRLLLNRQLVRLGHHVTEAENGMQALQLYRNNHFDLVITDCGMPIMDGLTLARSLRSEQIGSLSILGLTANAQSKIRQNCLDAGMDDCLFKPLRLLQLEETLCKIPLTNKIYELKGVLEDLVDLSGLQHLTQYDNELLHSLLRSVYEENTKDMQQALISFDTQQWLGLASHLHRLVGAAKIIGALDVEKCCRKLEKYCKGEPDVYEVSKQLKHSMEAINKLNHAIDFFIKKNGID